MRKFSLENEGILPIGWCKLRELCTALRNDVISEEQFSAYAESAPKMSFVALKQELAELKASSQTSATLTSTNVIASAEGCASTHAPDVTQVEAMALSASASTSPEPMTYSPAWCAAALPEIMKIAGLNASVSAFSQAFPGEKAPLG